MSDVPSIPITILTGFLGSGKTTLLNSLLKLPQLTDTAVVINEFGEVGIDHMLIDQAIEDAVLLKNGCVCCTMRGDIVDTLNGLWSQQKEGKIPGFRRIAIETTGLADPGPIAHTLAADGIAFAHHLDGIVTTVDALHGFQQLQEREEARNQVALADRIILTKIDLAGGEHQWKVLQAVRRLNGDAAIIRSMATDVRDLDIFGIGPLASGNDAAACWLGRTAGHVHDHDDHDHHDHGAFNHEGGIGSVLLSSNKPVSWPKLRAWLDSLLSLRGDQVLRIKGLVQVEEDARALVLQAVHHVVHPPVFMAEWPMKPQTCIVVIFRDLPADGLKQSFMEAVVEGQE